MVRFNYFQEKGAFTRDEESGTYRVNYDAMFEAMLSLTNTILIIQGDGDYNAAKEMLDMGFIQDELQADLDRLKEKGIPKDIVFKQGTEVLGL